MPNCDKKMPGHSGERRTPAFRAPELDGRRMSILWIVAFRRLRQHIAANEKSGEGRIVRPLAAFRF